jgi:predicted RNA-binding Zn-ribbon protein involved in translation (DUF1610 family)
MAEQLSTDTTGLLPCPLCLSANVQLGRCWVGERKLGDEPAALCEDCGCRATARAWNTRASITTASGEAATPLGWLHEITEPMRGYSKLYSSSPDNPWSHWLETYKEQCSYKVTPLYGSAAQAGWKPLPIDPTPEMISAGMGEIPEDGAEYEDVEAAYRAMVAAAVSSTQRACQVCGETADLKCGPSRFGAETWACKDCWEPEGSTVTSPTRQTGDQ